MAAPGWGTGGSVDIKPLQLLSCPPQEVAMRKLVRTVIINDEDEDEDDDEVNIHHRHHHVSTALGKALVPGVLSQGCWGSSGLVPVRVGGSSASHRIRPYGRRQLGGCCGNNPMGEANRPLAPREDDCLQKNL